MIGRLLCLLGFHPPWTNVYGPSEYVWTVTAGPPTEPPILTAKSSHIQTTLGYVELAIQALGTTRARLRDAEETLRQIADRETLYETPTERFLARAYFERHADPQEPV